MDYSKSKTLEEHVKNQQIGGLLYHYTSGTGLNGILSKREFWMTNTLYLNDHQEMKHLKTVADKVIDEMLKAEGISDYERKFLKRINNEEFKFNHCYYIGSFSGNGDSLPQWRGYCPKVGGFSLGIPAENLQRIVDRENEEIEKVTGPERPDRPDRASFHKRLDRENRINLAGGPNYRFSLIKCVYDEDKQKRIAQDIVQHYLDEFRRAMNFLDRGDKQVEFEVASKGIADEYLRYLEKVSGIIKHHSFESEQEWRIVSPKIDVTLPDINNLRLGDRHLSLIDFRETERGLICYYKFNLGDTFDLIKAVTKDLSHMEVICGPTANKPGAIEAAKTMLRKYGFSPRCQSSKIPYKTW